MASKKTIELVAAMAGLFILLSGIVVPQYANAQEPIQTNSISADSQTSWESVINASGSSDYQITSDGLLNLTGNSGVAITDEVETTSNHSKVVVNVTNVQGDATVTLYDGADNSLASTTVSGSTTTSFETQDYSADSYYVEFESTSTTDTHFDSFEAYTQDPVDSTVSSLILIIMVFGLLGLATAGFKFGQNLGANM